VRSRITEKMSRDRHSLFLSPGISRRPGITRRTVKLPLRGVITSRHKVVNDAGEDEVIVSTTEGPSRKSVLVGTSTGEKSSQRVSRVAVQIMPRSVVSPRCPGVSVTSGVPHVSQ